MSAMASRWGEGRPALRWARLTIASILVMALVMWGMGVALYIGVYRTPLENSPYARYPEHGWLYAFTCGLATITSILSIVELACSFLLGLNPLVSIVWSLASAVAWIYMWSEWFGCEIGLDYGDGTVCHFYYLRNEPYNTFTPSGSGRGLWIARLVVGMLLFLTYLAYTGLASAALHRNVQAAKRGTLDKSSGV